MKIVSLYISMRLDRKSSLKEVKQRERQVTDTLELASDICVQRHHVGLFRKMRENLPAFFGFEAVGILIYDFERDQFFTDRDTAEDVVKQPHGESDSSDEEATDDDESSPSKKSKKKPKGEERIDYQALAEDRTPAGRAAKLRAIYEKPFMTFPTASGLSGHVFKTK